MNACLQKLIWIAPLAATCARAGEMPSVVSIAAYAASRDEGAERGLPINRGLGFIVEKDGFLLTNYQCLTDPASGLLLEEFRVTVPGTATRTFNAAVIGVEPTINLGILKIASDQDFKPSRIARDKPVAIGARVAAVAGFEGVEPRVVEGEVVGLNTRECYQESLTSTMFRAKIALPDESAGGPVFFADGTGVAALHTGFKPAPEPGHVEVPGETHLLPISLCFNIYDSIKQKGSLKSPWTGFSVRALNAAEKGFFPTAKKHHGGIAIEHVWPGSPADKLGIREGDILVQFSYNRILNVGEFQKWLYMYGVGHPVKLMILRDGKEYLIADYVIEERPASARPR